MPIPASKGEKLADLFNLKGKVVAITGASRPMGIGLEVAARLRRNESRHRCHLLLTSGKRSQERPKHRQRVWCQGQSIRV